MKLLRIKRFMALGISALAMFLATTSSSMCRWIAFEEVEMPKSLIKTD